MPVYVTLVDGSRIPVTVECSSWLQDQPQKDSSLFPGIRLTVKPTSSGVASQRKISEDDDDDASDSERMVICEDEPAGMSLSVLNPLAKF